MKIVQSAGRWETNRKPDWESGSFTSMVQTWMTALRSHRFELWKNGKLTNWSVKRYIVNSIASGKNAKNELHAGNLSSQIRFLIHCHLMNSFQRALKRKFRKRDQNAFPNCKLRRGQ